MLMQVIDRLGDGIILFDRDAICRYLNPEAVSIVGKPPSEVVGKHIGEAVPDAMSNMYEGTRERLLAGEEVLAVPSYFAQGRWFEILGRPLGGDFIIHFRDITERLQAEAARRQTEERFQILVNGVKDYCLIMLDPKGLDVSWNVGAERMTGYSAGEMLGKTFESLYPRELRESGEPRRRLEMAVRHGSYTAERWFVRKDGSRFLGRSTYSSLLDELKRPSGFAIVARDITEQRRLETDLRTNEERLRLATRAGAVGTWEENLADSRMIADDQFLALCGLPPDGQPTFQDVLSRIHRDDRARVEEERRWALEANGDYEFQFEFRVARQDGETCWIECRGKSSGSTKSGGRRVVGVLHDTTKLHQFEEFRRLAPGIIAHDLRSPLSKIKLTSQTLIEREGLPAKIVQRVQSITRAVDRMVKMVEQLLLYTQAQFGGGFSLEKERTDLERVCRDAIDDVQASSPDAEIHLDAEGDCNGVWDRPRLTQVATNLIGNAVKHGQPRTPIYVLARDEGDRVALRVHNVGPPIPPELMPVIFEPFRRGSTDGFGLGLYIIREIVAAHGGTVEVSSSSAEGTTFVVHLPRGAGSPAHPAV
jgi:PAS domain S-box-containing protein